MGERRNLRSVKQGDWLDDVLIGHRFAAQVTRSRSAVHAACVSLTRASYKSQATRRFIHHSGDVLSHIDRNSLFDTANSLYILLALGLSLLASYAVSKLSRPPNPLP